MTRVLSLYCIACGGEGLIFKSRYGGNDPDVWADCKCEACDGSGNQRCDARGCKENAIAFDEDGRALCEECLAEWQIEAFGGE